MAERRSIEPKAHKCYKNFDRIASSTSIESDAIAEGFKNSLEMHGLIYKTVVADGDSNVYQSIVNNNPYQEQKVTVKKVECTNHLLRNLCKKLKAVSQTTQSKRKRGFVQIRNVVKNNILKLRKEVIEAAAIRNKENKPHHCKAMELQKDILNIPSHMFGEHKRCKERGRKCADDRDEMEKNYVPFLKVYGLYARIEDAFRYLSAYSDSLLLNLTNNPAESFNSIICKDIGGKRINFGKRGSYNARIAGAVVQYNTQQVLTQLHESMGKTVPPVVEKMEKQRQIKVARTKESRDMVGRSKKFKREQGTDRYYGPQSQQPDRSPDVYEQLRQNHMEKLLENGRNREKIECDTREQNESELWHSLRREMLTASNFGIICRMRPTTSCAATVKNILFPPIDSTVAMKYGRDNEVNARKELSETLNKEIKTCGLFIDNENPCLGASPDGLIEKDGLVEIKCPYVAKDSTAEEAVQKFPHLKGLFDKRNPDQLNRNHRYFYQVQGQLNITQRYYCIFAVWTPKSFKMTRINKDVAFWKNKMLPSLTRFYNECMLPEILDSRYNRHMPIREPSYIMEAKEEVSKKINSRKNNRRDVESESIVEDSKRFKPYVSQTETATIVPLNTEQDDDCVIVTYSNEKRVITEEVMAARKEYLENTIEGANLPLVRKNVLEDKLDDLSLDLFLRVVRENSSFETQSVQYLVYPDMIVASQSDKSLQIIGGNCTDHWRCIFFDGTKLRIYDSLPNCTYDVLVEEEKKYIHRRYPQIKKNNIMFEKVETQPDGTSCGIYAAAFATTVALGENPCYEKYSKDVKCMREHLWKIIEDKKLLPFPRR